ncbi:MAG: hypothetical protein Q8S13_09930 [Dehalococcoidia bacterium]|nr:hypothetical protein [Dehalococcoidia bacterium]
MNIAEIEALKARILREMPPEDRALAEASLKHFEEHLLGETLALLNLIPFIGPSLAGGVGWLCMRAYRDGYAAHERAVATEATLKQGLAASAPRRVPPPRPR